ncbi:STM4015 family protein [Desulfosarcina sp. OttesenSCG-928-B08]|nr:STM4015 family protein [Desulfosarcina sp. OttesenSCG-928-B08]
MKRYFVLQNAREKRFYTIETEKTRYTACYGRLDKDDAHTINYDCKDEKECQRDSTSLINSLLRNKYVEVTAAEMERIKTMLLTPTPDSARFGLTYDEVEAGKTNTDLINAILADEKLPSLKHLIIASWAEPWDISCQEIIDQLIAHSSRFSGIESLCMGEMESEECEISWILQGDYSKFWKAFPNLKAITIQSGNGLVLGDVASTRLESIEIITGGLPSPVIQSITKARTPNLRKLNLYLGIYEYGFDGGIENIKALVTRSDFPKLEYLGVCNSDLQDEIAELLVTCKYAPLLKTLDLSKGTLSDKGANSILKHAKNLKNLVHLDLSYHYISDEMQKKLSQLPFTVDLSDPQEPEDEDAYPMFTE